jgi:ribokinase
LGRIFVAGLINIETTVAIDGFPLDYFPVRYPFNGVHSSVSGVGWNITRALHVLGNCVEFASLIGPDENGYLARRALANTGIDDHLVLNAFDATPQSVILYDSGGRRQIHVDLKDAQLKTFPVDLAESALIKCDLAVICNINFARPLLAAAKREGKPIATDLHALADLDDEYNQEFLASASILFLSDERLTESPEDVMCDLLRRYPAEIVVIGLGQHGALLGVRKNGFIGRYPAVHIRPVVNTVGAGDALFAAFIDRYLRTGNPYMALEAAQVFAGYKIGTKSANEGFLNADELNALLAKYKSV